ncbi:unnamed protein product [Commensalibacter communis]|uniref:RloB-like protein n=1 Tax=Commensalibacter communis TaxID=2972786 RepID=A0A9W4XE52_9PROT|nr:RloB family protein [Commensalibacter communis]CAI3958209.1 unnamed protein product [Commensalibacter communis]CAI3959961.1 unnamed protein product [Commensalibacter communis]
MARFQNKRKTANREYRKTFHILWEGRVTEKEYFEWIGRKTGIVIRSIKKSNDDTTSCKKLLNLAEKYLVNHKDDIKRGDEIWIIIDQDNRNETDPYLDQLIGWQDPTRKYFVAVSDPKFEYWLLLHFECANNLSDAQNCCDRLEQCCQKQDAKYKLSKKFPSHFYTLDKVESAICNAKKRNRCKNEDDPFYTDVYLLVEKIIGNS